MGKNTYNSIGKKLDNRINIVLSNDIIRNCITIEKIDGIKEKYKKNNIFIIGGESVYKQFLNDCEYLYITKIYESFKCNKYFPDYENNFELINESIIKEYNNIKYQFCIYKKIYKY